MKLKLLLLCLAAVMLPKLSTAQTDQHVYGNLWLDYFRSTIFTLGDGLATHRGGIQFLTFDNGNTFIFQPTNEAGTPVNSTIRLGGFGAFNNNTVGLAITGNVGIGTTTQIDQKLNVNGKIKCEEVIVVVDVADYVFEKNYPLKKLEEVDQYIKENKHLPGVPGKKEVDANGYEVGLMTNKLLEKVEELTLYMIEQNKEIKALKEENKKITAELARLETKNK